MELAKLKGIAVELAQLKGLLGIAADDTSKDASLAFAYECAVETILNYCNLANLPPGLFSTAYRMAADIVRNENYGEEGSPAPVASISEGDTSVSFRSGQDSAYAASLLKNYAKQLNRYRKMRW